MPLLLRRYPGAGLVGLRRGGPANPAPRRQPCRDRAARLCRWSDRSTGSGDRGKTLPGERELRLGRTGQSHEEVESLQDRKGGEKGTSRSEGGVMRGRSSTKRNKKQDQKIE